MAEPTKRWSDQKTKKMAVKIGGGGGIGAVVLLGGALATAALASVFIVGKKGRSSGKDGSTRRRQSQDSPPEINKQNKEDEENKGEELIIFDQPSHLQKDPSGGETKEVEEDKDTGLLASTESLKLDEKPNVEINGGTQGNVYDGEASEQISSKKLEKDAISDGFVIVEDEKLPLEPQTMMQEDEVKTELPEQDVSNEISQESKNIDKIDVDVVNRLMEEKNVNGDEKEGRLVTEIVEMIQGDEASEGNREDEVKYVEIKEEKCGGTDQGIFPENGEEQGWTNEDNQSNTYSNLEMETDEKKIDSGNKDDDADTSNPTPENAQFGVEEEVISHEIKEEFGADVEETAESLEVNKNEISIVAEILEVHEEKIPIVAESLEVNKEKISIVADNCEAKDHEDGSERDLAEEVEEEVISPGNGVERNDVKELEASCEIIEIGIAKPEDDVIMETSEDDKKSEENLSDEAEESSVGTGDSSTESNSEAIWPAESLQETSMETPKKFIDQEVEGKIQEDKTVKESEENSQDPSFEPYHVKAEEKGSRKINANLSTEGDNSRFPYQNGNSDKTFVKKFMVNSTRWRTLIGALAVVSSLSGSLFFGLSFVKLCLIVFLTMVLSKIYGY